MPAPVHRINSVEQVREAVAEARERHCLRVLGGRSKSAFVTHDEGFVGLDVSGLSGITRYEPEELVLTARSGTRLAEVEAVLNERGQRLAFDPPDYASLLGAKPARSTLGGVVASGFAGPNRLLAGNVRDHVLGFEAVSGRGEVFRAGGRVMKNVTGYDLPKLMVGSWGTLAVLTEITLRVLPRPQHEATLLIDGLSDRDALTLIGKALRAPLEVAAAAHLPTVTAVRLEGFRSSIVERLKQLADLLGPVASTRLVQGEASSQWWRAVREVEVFQNDPRILWRLSLPASASAEVVAAISRRVSNEVMYDWGGSLVWMAMAASEDAASAIVRNEASRAGGHAWLMRAPVSVRREVSTAHPQNPALAALNDRVRSSFDPDDVFAGEPLWPDATLAA